MGEIFEGLRADRLVANSSGSGINMPMGQTQRRPAVLRAIRFALRPTIRSFCGAFPPANRPMTVSHRNTLAALGCALIAHGVLARPAAAQTSTLPNETPAKFTPATSSFDYVRREIMIPMRDGVKLHTVILVPKGAHRAPILMTRTPYDANATTTYAASAHLAPNLAGYDNALDVNPRWLHPRRAGCPRQVWLRRRFCHESPAHRSAQSHKGR